MRTIRKIVNLDSGELIFDFLYNDGLVPLIAEDFDVLDISNLKSGYDDLKNIDLVIYPTNIDIRIDDFIGDNYTIIKELFNSYSQTYPFNWDLVFKLKIFLNNVEIFDGIIDELDHSGNDGSEETESDTEEIILSFIDKINMLKNINIGNPAVLDELFRLNLISRAAGNTVNNHSFAYGFHNLTWFNVLGRTGYVVTDMLNAEVNPPLKGMLYGILRLLNPYITIDFENEFLFGGQNTPVNEMVTIDYVDIFRVFSNLLGRYVVLSKNEGGNVLPVIIDGFNFVPYGIYTLRNYNKANLFKVIYEDDNYITYYHNWSGNPDEDPQRLINQGTQANTVRDLLKIIAQNLFSFYGFRNPNEIFFNHRRFKSSATELTDISSIKKKIQSNKVDLVMISDMYVDNNKSFAKEGNIYGGEGETIEYKIPLNTVPTENGFEYRMVYRSGGHTYPVYNFYDKQNLYRDLPMKVIARAEYLAHKDLLDKYEIIKNGIVNIDYDKVYSVDFENYKGIFKPVVVEKNLKEDETILTALQIND